jgi:hypothetical protein
MGQLCHSSSSERLENDTNCVVGGIGSSKLDDVHRRGLQQQLYVPLEEGNV